MRDIVQLDYFIKLTNIYCIMTQQEIIDFKDRYLTETNRDYCTPDELAERLNTTGKNIRGKLRTNARMFNAQQDANGRWKIYKSPNYRRLQPTSSKQVEHLANSTVKSKVAASDAKSEDVKIGLAPWIGENPKVLILGSLPGDESLKQQAYYANNLNSFWKIMRELFNTNMESDNKKFITSCGIALWDCAHSAERKGSLDSAIVNSSVVANDIKALLLKHPTIQTIIFNGGKAEKFYHTYCSGIECKTIRLISTSSAAARRFEDKLKEWSIITELVK